MNDHAANGRIVDGDMMFELFSDKWTLLVLRQIYIGAGAARFNVLKRQMDGISQKTLTQSLRRLERNGLVSRHLVDTAPPGVEYSLTALGNSLKLPLSVLRDWSENNAHAIHHAQQIFDQKQTKAPRSMVARRIVASLQHE